jgi:hypothetical protein
MDAVEKTDNLVLQRMLTQPLMGLARFLAFVLEWLTHRNLRTGTSMLALALQKLLGKEHLLISALDKVIYFKGASFRGLQNLSSLPTN